MPEVLFLCTGNYYRSRFAEILFDYLSAAAGLGWTADSRGLALERGRHNVGPVAEQTILRLNDLDVPTEDTHRWPRELEVADLERAAHVVAVKEDEHRILLEERFPGWADRVEYWHVHDVEFESPATALTTLEQHVRKLVRRLAEQQQCGSDASA